MIAYHSLQFAVFFFVVFVLYYIIPKRAQWWLLLAARVYFYWVASGALILWLLVSAGLVWISGLGLERIAAEGSDRIKAGKGVQGRLTACGVGVICIVNVGDLAGKQLHTMLHRGKLPHR